MQPRFWIVLGSLLAGTAVAAGAFGAHGLDHVLVERYARTAAKTVAGQTLSASYKYLHDWKTAAEYQLAHALAVLVVGLLGPSSRGGSPSGRRCRNAAGGCFVLGIVLFSGSLYLLVLTGRTWLGAVTPLGGLLFLAGWSLLAFAAVRGEQAL